MMKNKIRVIIVLAAISAVLVFSVHALNKQYNKAGKNIFINPVIEDVTLTVVTTGVVEPQNRLEIKPSISGRIDEILVKEGDKVKIGEILAWMSSTERAALIDAARSQGDEILKYWEDVYKKTPIISPIDGEVIVRSVEPGQTVTASDPILVLSDRLIINAQFDETDIARVEIGQGAIITLDAYPDIKLEGIVVHIAYESEIINNVTIYDVDILPNDIPKILRSGMSVTIEVIEDIRHAVATIPSSAIHYDEKRQFVLVQESRGKIVERDVEIGLSNDKTAEVISGLSPEDSIVVNDTSYLPKRKNTGTNPFMPSSRKRNDRSK